MNREATISLSVALALGAFLSPHFARAADVHNNQSTNSAPMRVSAKREAARMVPAAADLKTTLDGRKLHSGEHFEAVLQQNVQLKNGPKLDHGTVLLGIVTMDRMSPGNARLSVRFTQARLKDGQTIPVKATVVDIAEPPSGASMNLADDSAAWNPHTLRVDEIGAIADVDMHSNIAGSNSAVFVSKKKDDVKLSAGSQIVVAIAERQAHGSMQHGAA